MSLITGELHIKLVIILCDFKGARVQGMGDGKEEHCRQDLNEDPAMEQLQDPQAILF